jgi:ABC-type branched-subunit amino acid transport system ATPase component
MSLLQVQNLSKAFGGVKAVQQSHSACRQASCWP